MNCNISCKNVIVTYINLYNCVYSTFLNFNNFTFLIGFLRLISWNTPYKNIQYKSVFIISLYKKITMTHITSRNIMYGAGEGNRTLLSSLGSSHSTDELRPHDVNIVSYIYIYIQVIIDISMIIPIVVNVLNYFQSRCIK